MDLTQQAELPLSKKEQKFKCRVEKILANQDLTLQRQLIERISRQLNIELIDCAAALALLSQSNLYPLQPKARSATRQLETKTAVKPPLVLLQPMPAPKMVRYRIEVGQKHHTTLEEIKSVLIEETGVDKKMIGQVDMRHHYTVIELPEGMPADIYQLLNSVSIQQQNLNIKRLKLRDRPPSSSQRKNKIFKD